MSKFYAPIMRSVLLLSLIGLSGCQPDVSLPNTLIPPGCRLGLATYIYENYTGDSTVYLYDTFGHLMQIGTVRKDKGRITRNATSTYGYSKDHYLTIRTDRTVTYPSGPSVVFEGVFSYEYQGDPKRIQAIKRISGIGDSGDLSQTNFQYNGIQLSQLREVTSAGVTSTLITFRTDGRPSQIQKANFQTIDLSNGLISRTISGRDTTLYIYDGQGQPTLINTSSGTTGERIERALTYDNRRPTRTGELKLRGFPDSDLTGYGQPQSNVLTETVRQFRFGLLTATSTLRYSYAYNEQGYATGYARSDGTRARFYYTNCP